MTLTADVDELGALRRGQARGDFDGQVRIVFARNKQRRKRKAAERHGEEISQLRRTLIACGKPGGRYQERAVDSVGFLLAVAAQCATARQPRLCATRNVGDVARSKSASICAIHSDRAGRVQLLCSTRAKCGYLCPQTVCQCPAPDPFQPGTMSTDASSSGVRDGRDATTDTAMNNAP